MPALINIKFKLITIIEMNSNLTYTLLNSSNFNKFEAFRQSVEKDFVKEKPNLKKNSKKQKVHPLKKRNLKIILVFDKSKIIGYVSYGFNKKRGWIRGIAIKKNYRNQGIGKKLYKKAISEIKKKKIKIIVTRTWSSNTHSINLIKKMGFIKTRTIKNTRINGDDTIWFKLEIK